jgi:hypothetical protein
MGGPGWQEALTLAIRLAGSCHAAYLKARPKVRTRFNQAVLEAVYVKDRQLQRVEITEVFEALFSPTSGPSSWVVRVHPDFTDLFLNRGWESVGKVRGCLYYPITTGEVLQRLPDPPPSYGSG